MDKVWQSRLLSTNSSSNAFKSRKGLQRFDPWNMQIKKRTNLNIFWAMVIATGLTDQWPFKRWKMAHLLLGSLNKGINSILEKKRTCVFKWRFQICIVLMGFVLRLQWWVSLKNPWRPASRYQSAPQEMQFWGRKFVVFSLFLLIRRDQVKYFPSTH